MVSELKLTGFCQFARSFTKNPDYHLLERYLGTLYLNWREEDALWFTALHQVYGDLASTAVASTLLPSPRSPLTATVADKLRELPNSSERPNLRGGQTVRHVVDLQQHIADHGGSLRDWLTQGWHHDPAANFTSFVTTAQAVWGSGGLATYRWASLLKRVHRLPIASASLCQDPNQECRRALVRLSGLTAPNDAAIHTAACTLRTTLTRENVPITCWEDLDTLLEKWYRLGKGRYALGHDLARLRDEIESPGVPEVLRPTMTHAWAAVMAEQQPYHLVGRIH